MQRVRRRAPSPGDRTGAAAWWRPAGGDAPAELAEPLSDGDLDAETADGGVGATTADDGPADGSPAVAPPAARPPRALPPRPVTSRPARAPRPGALPPARAVAGAAVAVAGVCLGIGTLLWATDPPDADPVARTAAASAVSDPGPSGDDEPAVALPGDDGAPAEVETAPVDPPPLPEPPAAEGQAAPAVPAEPAAPAPPAVRPVPVLVLNNSRVDGLAARAAATFERGGWPVKDTGGLRGRIRATTVYYPAGQEAVARAFAERFDGIERVLPRLAGLPGSGLTVVVTRDFRP